MNPVVGAAAINGGSSLAGTGLQYVLNKKFYDYEHETNVQDWYRENAYNSPAEQMARLKAAGLNPNLVYQSGNPVGSAGSIETASSPNFGNDLAQAGQATSQALVDSYYRQQELENENTNIMSLVAYRAFLNDFTESKTKGQEKSNEKADAESEYYSENAYYDFLQKRQAFQLGQKKIKQAEADLAYTWSQNAYTRQGIKNLKKSYNLTDTQIKSLEEGMRKMQTEQWEILFNAGLNKLKYDLSASEKTEVINKYKAEIEKLQAETAYIDTQNDLRSFMASGRKKLASEINGDHGVVSEATANMLFYIYDLMANMPFSGIFK